MSTLEPILYVGDEPEGKYVPKLKLLLAELILKNRGIGGKIKFPLFEIQVNGCWIWKKSKCWNGYGMVKFENKTQVAHRFVYEKLQGFIPEGLTLDHLCRNRTCCNPSHLEPVTMRENLMRSPLYLSIFSSINRHKTHCKNGHEFNKENTCFRKRKNGGTERACRACRRKAKIKISFSEVPWLLMP